MFKRLNPFSEAQIHTASLQTNVTQILNDAPISDVSTSVTSCTRFIFLYVL